MKSPDPLVTSADHESRIQEPDLTARRSDVVALAQEMFRLQIGHHGGLWFIDETQHALSAAEAFMTESRKETP